VATQAAIDVSVGLVYDRQFVFLETTDAAGCRSSDVVIFRGANCAAPTPEVRDTEWDYVSAVTVAAGEPLTLYNIGPPYYSCVGQDSYWMIGEAVIGTGPWLDGYIFAEPGEYTLVAAYKNNCGCVGLRHVQVIVLPVELPHGQICGRVVDVESGWLAGVTVKLIDTDNNQVGEPVVTGPDGTYEFVDLEVKPYTVMIVTPLGMAVTPAESIPGIEPADPCRHVDFVLVPTVATNDCRGMGYWKHQFDVYLTGRGHAQEMEADLQTYLSAVHTHFDVLGIYTGLGEFDFQDAKDVLTVRGGKLAEDRARQHLFALLLNFASGRIGNYTVVTEDGRYAADAVTLASALIGDGDPENDRLAKNLSEWINAGRLIAAGIVPAYGVVYKLTGDPMLPEACQLEQNHPNPFNPVTRIEFRLPHQTTVHVDIFNSLGRRVATPVDCELPAGQHAITWDARDLPSGVYFYRLRTPGQELTRRMLLLR